MFKKYLSLALACLLAHIGMTHACAAARGDGETQLTARVKTDVAKRGVGERARVKVKLRNGTELKGHISEAGEDAFDLVDSQSGVASRIAYGDVARVKSQGMSKAKRMGLITGITAAVVVVGIVGLRAGGSLPFPAGPGPRR